MQLDGRKLGVVGTDRQHMVEVRRLPPPERHRVLVRLRDQHDQSVFQHDLHALLVPG